VEIEQPPLLRVGEYPPLAEAREERSGVHHAFYNHLILHSNQAKLPKQRGVAISGPAANGAPRMPVNNPISNLQA
jgi:hypothetical protein